MTLCNSILYLFNSNISGSHVALYLQVPSSQKHVSFAWNETDYRNSRSQNKSILKSRDFLSPRSASDKGSFVEHIINFSKVWTSEKESKGRHTFSKKNVIISILVLLFFSVLFRRYTWITLSCFAFCQAVEDNVICSIWRPICPDGYLFNFIVLRIVLIMLVANLKTIQKNN